ncbi:MAG: DapH/DapD/GlmU-related protein [Cyanobacteria bacterium J06635_15]
MTVAEKSGSYDIASKTVAPSNNRHRPSAGLSWQRRIKTQIDIFNAHSINLLSNLLGNDWLSCWLRKHLLSLLGNQWGSATVIKTGGYFCGGRLKTGHQCHINHGCYFDFTGPITFGSHVVVGHGVTFVTAHHALQSSSRRAGPVEAKGITVGDGVWIGANATLLPDVTIGSGAVIGAGAVVTRSIPANVVVAGVPAKVIRILESAGEY